MYEFRLTMIVFPPSKPSSTHTTMLRIACRGHDWILWGKLCEYVWCVVCVCVRVCMRERARASVVACALRCMRACVRVLVHVRVCLSVCVRECSSVRVRSASLPLVHVNYPPPPLLSHLPV